MIAPRVTILMPVYNSARFLPQAIDSILAQTFEEFEFLILDDGSTDESADLIKTYRDLRIRFVQNERNLGIAATLNKGIAMAEGNFIARMDADDICFPSRLEKQIHFLDANPDIGIIASACQYILPGQGLGTVWKPFLSHNTIQWDMCFHCPIPHPTVVIRKEVFARTGGYSLSHGGQRAEDYNLWREAIKVTRVASLPDVLLYLRRHDNNDSTIYLSEYRLDVVRISSLIICDILGHAVSVGLVEKTISEYIGTADEAYQCAELVHKLYHAFLKEYSVSRDERCQIAHDAADRIFRWAYHLYGLKEARARPVLRWAWKVDPQQTTKALARLTRRKAARHLLKLSFHS